MSESKAGVVAPQQHSPPMEPSSAAAQPPSDNVQNPSKTANSDWTESPSIASPSIRSKSDTNHTFRTPSRMTTLASSLSAPALAKPQVNLSSHLNDARRTPPSPSATDSLSARSLESSRTLSNGSGDEDSESLTRSPSSSAAASALASNPIAVSHQPPVPQPHYQALGQPSPGPAKESQQNFASQTVGTAHQVPTIAQRDALACRVYSTCQTSGNSAWLHLLDLAPLASQHHLSNYNCMKFGIRGSPYAYFPLTLQHPWEADAVAEKQRAKEREALTWSMQKRLKKRGKSQEADRGVKRGGGVLDSHGRFTADRSVDPVETTGNSAKIARGNEDGATLNMGIDGASTRTAPQGNVAAAPHDDVRCTGPLLSEESIDQEWETPVGTELAQNGSNSLTRKSGVTEPAIENTPANQQTVANSSGTAAATSMKTSDTHPISISPIIPPELLIDVTRYVQMGLPDYLHSFDSSNSNGLASAATDDDFASPRHVSLQREGKRLIRCRTPHIDLSEVAQRADKELEEAFHAQRRPRLLSFQPTVRQDLPCLDIVCLDHQSTIDEADKGEMIPLAFGGSFRGFTVGNMLLSSCPGKKVRLTGPVRGRGTICRNLGLDLKRIKQLGVGALVCCLDDEELAFLGAPWSLYEKEADQLGMEVVRLPMAEGFSPTDVPSTDNAITNIVEQYTLRGINVLVHCRGGVGRAGLIACMWMLKLGLVRSDEENNGQMVTQNGVKSRHDSLSTDESSRRSTMQIIHRLIDTIRRRRSPKAIETAEQVAFLFKYVTFIREQERISQSPSSRLPPSSLSRQQQQKLHSRSQQQQQSYHLST